MLEKIKNTIGHWFGFHKVFYVKRLSSHSHMLRCEICLKKFCFNTSAKVIVPWDEELENFYKDKKDC